MNNENLEENFVNGNFAVHVTTEEQFKYILNYAKELGIDIDFILEEEESDKDTYLNFPYLFVNDDNSLDGYASEHWVGSYGCKCYEFEEVISYDINYKGEK